MSGTPLVIGVDPGQTTGVAVLSFENGGYLLRLASEIPYDQGPVGMVKSLLEGAWMADRARTIIAAERFVVRGRAARSAHPEAGEMARVILGGLQTYASELGYQFVTRSASEAKGWATDGRLKAAGLYELTRSAGGHRRDATRHALMAGVMKLGWTDPLSKTFNQD